MLVLMLSWKKFAKSMSGRIRVCGGSKSRDFSTFDDSLTFSWVLLSAASDGDQIKKQLMELQIRAKSLVEELQKTQEEKSHMFRDLEAARCEIDTQQSVILDLQTSLKDYQTIIQQKNASFDELTQANSPRRSRDFAISSQTFLLSFFRNSPRGSLS